MPTSSRAGYTRKNVELCGEYELPNGSMWASTLTNIPEEWGDPWA